MSETDAEPEVATSARRLVLHIGSHKTGTTSIQHNLAHNTEVLGQAGLTYFAESRVPTDDAPPDLHSWLGFVDREDIAPHGMALRDPEVLTERLAATEGDLVISSENFSFFFTERAIADLHAVLSPLFGRIHVVCYLRRQDRHVISHHQEGSKARRRAEYQLFGHSGRAIPPWTPRHDLYLDYHRRLSMWADVFGRDAVVIRPFDRARLHQGDAVADFFALLGISSFTRVPDRNQSVGRNRAKIGHLVNATPLAHRQLISALVRDRVGDGERAMPSRWEAMAYYERYRAGNAALEQWALPAGESLFDDAFDEYDSRAQDRWDEDSANEVITVLLEALDSVASRSDQVVDRLRDIAIEVGDDEPEVAIALLRLAADLRPGGPLIQRKLREFEERLHDVPADAP